MLFESQQNFDSEYLSAQCPFLKETICQNVHSFFEKASKMLITRKSLEKLFLRIFYSAQQTKKRKINNFGGKFLLFLSF